MARAWRTLFTLIRKQFRKDGKGCSLLAVAFSVFVGNIHVSRSRRRLEIVVWNSGEGSTWETEFWVRTRCSQGWDSKDTNVHRAIGKLPVKEHEREESEQEMVSSNHEKERFMMPSAAEHSRPVKMETCHCTSYWMVPIERNHSSQALRTSISLSENSTVIVKRL